MTIDRLQSSAKPSVCVCFNPFELASGGGDGQRDDCALTGFDGGWR